eukprot:jgi/Chrzof1/14051/Cz08g22190.t1
MMYTHKAEHILLPSKVSEHTEALTGPPPTSSGSQAEEPISDIVAHALATLYLSVVAFVNSCKNPVVVNILRRTITTVAIAAVSHYVLLTLMLWPLHPMMRVVSFLTACTITVDIHSWVTSSMAVYPLMTMSISRLVYGGALRDCFLATLHQLDPPFAAELQHKPPLHVQSTAGWVTRTALRLMHEDLADPKKMLMLMLVSCTLRIWKRIPLVGIVVSPVVQYLSIRYMVENRVAAGILAAVAALHRPAERFILQFVEVSRLLGQALNGHDACILVAIHVCFG